MNDTTVWCQNASVTEPQRDRGTTTVVDEAFEKINSAQCGVIVRAIAKSLFFNPRWHHAAIALKAAHCDSRVGDAIYSACEAS